MAEGASSSDSWLDKILNTGTSLYTAYAKSQQPAAQTAAQNTATQSSFNSKWLIYGGIGLVAVVGLILLFRR